MNFDAHLALNQVFSYTQILRFISFDLCVSSLELVSDCYDKYILKCISCLVINRKRPSLQASLHSSTNGLPSLKEDSCAKCAHQEFAQGAR